MVGLGSLAARSSMSATPPATMVATMAASLENAPSRGPSLVFMRRRYRPKINPDRMRRLKDCHFWLLDPAAA
jgi:hypothetical protein